MYTIARGDKWRRSGGCQIHDMIVIAATLATTASTKHLCVCMSTCVRVHMCVCIYAYMYICIYVYMYICIYVYMYI